MLYRLQSVLLAYPKNMHRFTILVVMLLLCSCSCSSALSAFNGKKKYRTTSILLGIRNGHQDEDLGPEDFKPQRATSTLSPDDNGIDGDEARDSDNDNNDYGSNNADYRAGLRDIYTRLLHATAKLTIYDTEHQFLGHDGAASGVLWNKDGYIVTAYHNVRNSTRIVVRLGGMSRSMNAELIGSDPERDIAVLKLLLPEDEGLLHEPIRKLSPNHKEIFPGEAAIAVGNPSEGEGGDLVREFTMTKGIVSSIDCDAKIRGDSTVTVYPGLIQTDAAVQFGFSGGPLVNSDTELIGILIGGNGAGTFSFAVPFHAVDRIVRQIIASGTSTRAAIGCYVISPAMEQQIEGLSGFVGAIEIQRIHMNSPLADAGLNINAVNADDEDGETIFIVMVDGKRVLKAGQLRSILDTKVPGDSVELEVLSQEGVKTILVNTTSIGSFDTEGKNWIVGEEASELWSCKKEGLSVDDNGKVHVDEEAGDVEVAHESIYDVLI